MEKEIFGELSPEEVSQIDCIVLSDVKKLVEGSIGEGGPFQDDTLYRKSNAELLFFFSEGGVKVFQTGGGPRSSFWTKIYSPLLSEWISLQLVSLVKDNQGRCRDSSVMAQFQI